MKILHTSDWHLGRSLYGRDRFNEFSLFLDWVIDCVNSRDIDVLLISGDVFDTTTPGNRAQELYYRFLFRISESRCKHVIITSGNHDSPSFLKAPSEILKFINIYIVTSGMAIEEQVIFLDGLTVCAVPYLRDRDIRTVDSGESIDDKNSKLAELIKAHYRDVCNFAKSNNKNGFPIIAMGHLFVAGGKTLSDDGVRDLYVGSLSNVGSDIIPPYIDYTALGHLHVPQIVGGNNNIRYSGSPIPMGFGEAAQNKIVIEVEFKEGNSSITELNIPKFQDLVRIKGSKTEIINKINNLKILKSSAWLEIEYFDDMPAVNLQDDILEAIEGSAMEVRIIKNSRFINKILNTTNETEQLDELSKSEVFEKCLEAYNVPEDSRIMLKDMFHNIVKELEEEDKNL